MLHQAEKRLLNDVFGILRMAKHPQRERIDLPFMARGECLERVEVPRIGAPPGPRRVISAGISGGMVGDTTKTPATLADPAPWGQSATMPASRPGRKGDLGPYCFLVGFEFMVVRCKAEKRSRKCLGKRGSGWRRRCWCRWS